MLGLVPISTSHAGTSKCLLSYPSFNLIWCSCHLHDQHSQYFSIITLHSSPFTSSKSELWPDLELIPYPNSTDKPVSTQICIPQTCIPTNLYPHQCTQALITNHASCTTSTFITSKWPCHQNLLAPPSKTTDTNYPNLYPCNDRCPVGCYGPTCEHGPLTCLLTLELR